MKNLFLFICILSSGYIFGQSTINFKKNRVGDITITGNTNLKIPIRIEFDNPAFKNDNIEIFEGDNSLTNGPKEIRVNVDPNNRIGPFVIKIAKYNNNKVKIPSLDINVPDSASLTIKINGTQVGIISYKYKNDKPQDSAKNDSYQAGYVYYDAMAIVSSISDKEKTDIIKKYGYTGGDNNLYLKSFYPKGAGSEQQLELLSNLGNTDVTYFAAGLARFLAERTKEELNEAFFNKMKEQLNTYPELTTAFPQTAKFLNIIETYSYASVLQVLKEAFETDVQNLPENLYNIKSLTEDRCDDNKLRKKDSISCHERIKKLSEFFTTQDGRWVALGMYSVKEAIQSTNPAELIKSITGSVEFDSLKYFKSINHNDYNIISAIELSNAISQSLVSKDDKQVWISKKQLDSLFTQPNAFKVYLGLILALEQQKEENKKIAFYNKADSIITLDSLLRKIVLTHETLKPIFKNAHAAYNSANNAIKKMIAASEKSAEVEPQALYDYYKTFTSALKPIANSAVLDTLLKRDIGVAYDKVDQFLNPAVDIAYHIATKKYSAAIYDASILLTSLNDVVDTDKQPVFKPITKSFVKYGTLISTVANAQSSEEVKKAIEASALPTGSYSIKRKSAWSISVNGYVGGYCGMAHTTSLDTVRNTIINKLDTLNNEVSYKTFGLYAPVGISFNRGFRCGWGVSFTAQILDLGALVNFYLKEGDKAALPTDFKVNLSDILSPGVQLSINFPKTPLTIMGGIQYVPALRSVSQISTNQALNSIAWRGQIGLVVDIPMYNLKVWDFKK